MTRARLYKTRRLLAVQREMQRLEEVRVAGLSRQQAELAAEQEELVAALNADEALQGLFIGAMARRLKSLNEAEMRIEKELEQRRAVLRVQAGRTKYAERKAVASEEQDARARAQKELLEVIERAVRPGDASLP